MGDTDQKHTLLQADFFQRFTTVLRMFIHAELHGFGLTVCNGVHGDGGTGLILHGADIADDVIAGQFSGTYHAAQCQSADNTAAGIVAQFGDYLRNLLCRGVERDDHIQFIHTGQGNQRIGLGKSFAFQKTLFANIAVNNIAFGKQFTQFSATVVILLNNLGGNTGFLQTLCQIVADSASAAEGDIADPAGQEA